MPEIQAFRGMNSPHCHCEAGNGLQQCYVVEAVYSVNSVPPSVLIQRGLKKERVSIHERQRQAEEGEEKTKRGHRGEEGTREEMGSMGKVCEKEDMGGGGGEENQGGVGRDSGDDTREG